MLPPVSQQLDLLNAAHLLLSSPDHRDLGSPHLLDMIALGVERWLDSGLLLFYQHLVPCLYLLLLSPVFLVVVNLVALSFSLASW